MKMRTNGLLLSVIVLTFLVGCGSQDSKKIDEIEESLTKQTEQTDPSPAIYQTAQEQANRFESYSELYKGAIEANEKEKDFGMYTIPGLLETLSLENNSSETKALCDSMTPQGVTSTDDYLLVSSYCHEHKHNSVVYVMEKNTHRYIKTIVLQGQPHVGGVTYDPIAKNIWVCSRYNDRAEIVAIPLDVLEKYKFEDKEDPISYSQKIELPQLSRASVITYSDQTIYVGYFDAQQEGKLEAYPINEKGLMAGEPAFEHQIRTTMDVDDSQTSAAVVRELQGITFFEDKLLITQSYGALSDSKLLIFDYDKKKKLFLDKEIRQIIELPAHAEQLSEDNEKLYMIFESAAKPYRLIEKTWVDRVLTIDIKKLLK